MKKTAALVVMMIGMVVAGVFGARNGNQHAQYRVNQSELGLLAAELEVNPDDETAREDIERVQRSLAENPLPAPGPRISQWGDVAGWGFGFGLVLVIVGGVFARREVIAQAQGTSASSDAPIEFERTVSLIVESIEPLLVRVRELDDGEDEPKVRESIDTVFDDHIHPVVNARGQLEARHGMMAYSAYFSDFASGERWLARAWSGLTDGYPRVSEQALERAIELFSNAGRRHHDTQAKLDSSAQPVAQS